MGRILIFLFVVALVFGIVSSMRKRRSHAAGLPPAVAAGLMEPKRAAAPAVTLEPQPASKAERIRHMSLERGRDLIRWASYGAGLSVLINILGAILVAPATSDHSSGPSLVGPIVGAALIVLVWRYPVRKSMDRARVRWAPSLLSAVLALSLIFLLRRSGIGAIAYAPSAVAFAIGVLLYAIAFPSRSASPIRQKETADA